MNHDFDTLWDTFELAARTLSLDATQTLEPSSSLLDADRTTIPELPRILSTSGTDSQLEVVGEIGRGGMGVIRLGRQLALQRDVAIKQVRDDRRSDRAAASLTTEGLLIGGLEHPNIVPVYLLGQDDDGYPTLVMKRIDGVSWSDVLERTPAADSPTHAVGPSEHDDPFEWHLDVLMQVANAVHFAHSRGIVHRDLKPDNVMVGAFGEVYLLDWGIAVSVDPAHGHPFPRASQVRDVSGTPAYMAPELVAGDGAQIGPRTDVYLLGAMLHEVVTGQPPHTGSTMFEIMRSAYESAPDDYPDVAPELARICRRAMAREPNARYASADDFRRAIAGFLRHRESFKLKDQADAEATRLRDHLQTPDGGDPDPDAAWATFQSALFGYDAALSAWPENEAARAARAELVEQMFAHEVAAEDARAARRLLGMLPSPTDAQRAEVDRLDNLVRSRNLASQQLEEIRFDRDLAIRGKWRAFIHLDIGTFWGMAALIYIFSGLEASHWWVVAASVVGTVTAGAVLVWKREYFMPNSVGQQLIGAYGVSVVGLIAAHALVELAHAPVHLAFVFDALVFGVVSGTVAMVLDRRLAIASVGFIVTAIVAAAFPGHAFPIVAVGVAIVQAIVAVVDWLNSHRVEA